MNHPDLASLAEIIQAKDKVLTHLDELNAKLESFCRLERPTVIAIIQTLMSIHDVSPREAITWKPASRSLQGKTVVCRQLAPKYRHSISGQTWAGRGMQPRWLRAELAAGKSLESFRVGEVDRE